MITSANGSVGIGGDPATVIADLYVIVMCVYERFAKGSVPADKLEDMLKREINEAFEEVKKKVGE